MLLAKAAYFAHLAQPLGNLPVWAGAVRIPTDGPLYSVVQRASTPSAKGTRAVDFFRFYLLFVKDIMSIIHSALDYCVLPVIAYLSGHLTCSIPWKTVGIAPVLQLLLAAILLQPTIRSLVFGLASDLTILLEKTALIANESLLFSIVSAESFVRQHGPMVAFEIAAILIFAASLSPVLYNTTESCLGSSPGSAGSCRSLWASAQPRASA